MGPFPATQRNESPMKVPCIRRALPHGHGAPSFLPKQPHSPPDATQEPPTSATHHPSLEEEEEEERRRPRLLFALLFITIRERERDGEAMAAVSPYAPSKTLQSAVSKPQDPISHAAGNGGHRRNLPPITVLLGQTALRLLCHVAAIGGVIGRSGAIVKQLERESGARIRVDDTVPECAERVITVVGSALCDRKVTLRAAGEADEEECEVSQAQDALLCVYDRVLEVEARMEGGCSGVTCCRLLAQNGQIGAVMGKGGKTIEKMRNDTGAKIRILPAEQVPACATTGDELIQIMGAILAVKKALVTVSRCLQECPPLDKAPKHVGRPVEVASYGDFPDPHVEFQPQNNSSLPSLPGNSVDYTSGRHPLSTDFDRITNLDAKSGQHEVKFKLLCPNGAVGGVIGKGGAIVKALQKETGASINVAAPFVMSSERVVTISALENSESFYSAAQNAVARVFMRAIEASIENGLISALNKGVTVTVKLLVASNQINCLIGEGGVVVSEIREATGAEVLILGGDPVPNCASENEEVVQITGEYENVQSALFQITGRLRDNIFPGKLLNGTGPRSCSAIPDVSSYERAWETTSTGFSQSLDLSYSDQETALARRMNHLAIKQKMGGPPTISSKLQPSQTMGRGNTTALTDDGGAFKTFRGGLEVERFRVRKLK
ncbi:KH domain-containing protein HEN4-like isoform X2 [Malania oleifera]|uniref:KH domain-containing protein HEN4-like isoform X2 n=1 Tax=Malania oleifera TaxID=397392 RepID=UPI0025ADEC69|nr:KH domain-containing protein HEN4-like isoform X2 [Malania oleifera]